MHEWSCGWAKIVPAVLNITGHAVQRVEEIYVAGAIYGYDKPISHWRIPKCDGGGSDFANNRLTSGEQR